MITTIKCIHKRKCKNHNPMTCSICNRNLANPYTSDYFEPKLSIANQDKGEKNE